jgi:8-oxo-dGTP pyrophosphatase MutT (NUDIX family)
VAAVHDTRFQSRGTAYRVSLGLDFSPLVLLSVQVVLQGAMPISSYLRQLRVRVGSTFVLLPSVTSLVFDHDGRLLLARHAHEQGWGTIGGAIDPDESPEDAVVRETWEETGLHVEPTRLRAVLGGPRFRVTYPNGDQVGYVAAVFDCRQIGGTLRPDGEEITEARFFQRSELTGLDLSPYAEAILSLIGVTDVPIVTRVTWRPPQP